MTRRFVITFLDVCGCLRRCDICKQFFCDVCGRITPTPTSSQCEHLVVADKAKLKQ